MFAGKKFAGAVLKAASNSKNTVVIKLVAKSSNVHLNEEGPFSFKVTAPVGSTIDPQLEFNLEKAQASFGFIYGGAPGNIVVSSRLFYCSDAGQCVSEAVEFDIPVETGTTAHSEHVIVFDYDVETKKKIFF